MPHVIRICLLLSALGSAYRMTSDPAGGDHGHAAMAERMADLATAQPGYLGIESARGPDRFGITVSYWESAQEAGVNRWYEPYELTAWTAP